MSCESFREALVSRLYAELDPADGAAKAEDERLEEHLAGCDACRAELDELSETRALLGAAEPVAPPTPRVVVLSRPAVPRYLSFAAGIGWGAVLLSIGLVTGWKLAPADPVTAEMVDGPSVEPTIQAVPAGSDQPDTVATIEAIEAMQRKIDDQERRIQMLTAPPAQQANLTLTRQEYESGLARLRDDLDQRQADHVRFFFDEVRGVEARTNGRINETQQVLQHIVLANDPSISAQ